MSEGRLRRWTSWLRWVPVLLAVVGCDRHQCDRRCAEIYGVSGVRRGDQCLCDGVAEPVSRPNPAVALEARAARLGVCGTDGLTHASADAVPAGVDVLHAGPCGACSNPSDIAVYRATADDLTGTATRCARRYFVFGEGAATRCFQEVGLSPACTACWVDNMGCTIVHCKDVCLAERRKGFPPGPDGALNPCYACDEAYCGGPFARCAGANRRRSGILSDIPRPDDQVWRPPSSE